MLALWAIGQGEAPEWQRSLGGQEGRRPEENQGLADGLLSGPTSYWSSEPTLAPSSLPMDGLTDEPG